MGLIDLKILKAYIKNNLANNFIKSFKFFIRTSIFFNQKLNKNLQLCVNYQDFINLTIKNRYLLQLIEESFDWLG